MAILTGYLHKLTSEENEMVRNWVKESREEYAAKKTKANKVFYCAPAKTADSKGTSAKRRRSA